MFGDAFNGGMVCILKAGNSGPGKFQFSGFERNDADTLRELFTEGMPDASAGSSSEGIGWVGIWSGVELWATGSNGGTRRSLFDVIMIEQTDGGVMVTGMYDAGTDHAWQSFDSWRVAYEPDELYV